MARFHAQGLLTLALCVLISEGKADSAAFDAVIATKKEDVALSCLVSNLTDQNSYRVRWIKSTSDAKESKEILARPKTPKIQDAPRVKWQANEQGEMSLFLTNLQESDEGMYSCETCKGWVCEIRRNISLKVKQCKVGEAVKVAPSASVSLTCPVDVTQGPQNILWEKLKGEDTETLPNGTSLAIRSASSSDSGWYRCKFMIRKTQHCFEIKLQVENVAVSTSEPVGNVAVTTSSPALTISLVILETRREGSSGVLIAVILSVIIIGIAIMAAVARLIIHTKRNNQRALDLTFQTQRPITGPAEELPTPYEIVDFTPSNSLLTRVNSLYQDQDGNMCTFNY
ncbi:uncharacterized protein LOC141801036 [Halichoeres trimaculatus]|uniref:uncharacterized protein LOC141801036 n=1 Tax=Halichoeres trimaculatus TaxID=147232 RepID=UPI003D9F378F